MSMIDTLDGDTLPIKVDDKVQKTVILHSKVFLITSVPKIDVHIMQNRVPRGFSTFLDLLSFLIPKD